MINQSIPEFSSLQAYDPAKGEFRSVSSSDLLGAKRWVVLFFYPADFTFVCPTELEDLQSKYDQLQKLGVDVYSVSTDTHFVHKAWHDSSQAIKKIRFPMIADPAGVLTRALGVHIEKEGVSLRGTFVADPDGVIKVAEIHDNGIGRNADELVRKVQAAIYVRENDGEVCPAKWEPGQDTLKPGLDLVGKI